MREKRILKTLRSMIVLLLAVGMAIVMIKMKPKPKKLPPPPASLWVEVMPVKASSLDMTIQSYGTVRPGETLHLVSEVKGKAVEIALSFEEGEFFSQGALLIRIDPRSYELAAEERKKQLKQIDAELRLLGQENQNLQTTLKIVQADVELAKADWERFKTLVEQGVVSRANQDQAEQKYLAGKNRMQETENQIAMIGPRVDQLKAQRELVEVQLEEALLDLDRTRIKAPFDGWVLEKRVEKGQFVTAGTPLGRIYRASNLEVEVRIPFKDLPWLFELSSAEPKGHLNGAPVRANIISKNAGQNYTWEGRLARIKAEVDEKTRTLPLVIEVPPTSLTAQAHSPYSLKPGTFVHVELIGKRVDKVYTLPRTAIHPGDLVYLNNDENLVIQPVKVLRRLNDLVYVSEGLKDEDLVITTPISIPREGAKLRLRRKEQPQGLER